MQHVFPGRKMVAAVVLLCWLGWSSSRCTPRLAEALVSAAIVTSAILVIAHHDAHYHDEHCGHTRVIVEQRDVYYYQGHWEYYDEQTGQWYRYAEQPAMTPAPAQPYTSYETDDPDQADPAYQSYEEDPDNPPPPQP